MRRIGGMREDELMNWLLQHIAVNARTSITACLIAASLVTACGGAAARNGVATLGPAAGSGAAASAKPSASSGDARTAMLAFAQCMREHGVANFPDPGEGGSFRVEGGPGKGIDPQSSTMDAAQQACAPLLPKRPEGAAGDERGFAEALKFSACMRSHGVPNFPDPQRSADGGITLMIGGPDSSDVDPNSPAMKAAEQACQSFMPGPVEKSTETVRP
jgi:hypothetical protein